MTILHTTKYQTYLKNLIFLFLVGFFLAACSKDVKDGSVVFYTKSDTCGFIIITLAGESVGGLTTVVSVAADCNDAGTLTINKSPGDYVYSAEDDCHTYSGSLTVTEEDCIAVVFVR